MIKVLEANENVYHWNGEDEVPKDVVNVIIDDGVTEICYNAFRGCENLIEIAIPDSVTYIGENAFNLCTSLVELVLPKSVTYIDEFAFSSCKSLKKLVIPNAKVVLGANNIFAYCGDDNLTVYCGKGSRIERLCILRGMDFKYV